MHGIYSIVLASKTSDSGKILHGIGKNSLVLIMFYILAIYINKHFWYVMYGGSIS